MTETAIPDDIRNAAREAAGRVADLHHDPLWIDRVAKIFEDVLHAERHRGEFRVALADTLQRIAFPTLAQLAEDMEQVHCRQQIAVPE